MSTMYAPSKTFQTLNQFKAPGWNSQIDKILLILISISIKCDNFSSKSTQTDNVSCEFKEQCSFIGNLESCLYVAIIGKATMNYLYQIQI